jgi:hypothetical protein
MTHNVPLYTLIFFSYQQYISHAVMLYLYAPAIESLGEHTPPHKIHQRHETFDDDDDGNGNDDDGDDDGDDDDDDDDDDVTF